MRSLFRQPTKKGLQRACFSCQSSRASNGGSISFSYNLFKQRSHTYTQHTPVSMLNGKIPLSSICRFGSGSSQASQNSGDICRICHCESDPQNPLLTPCYCSGSLKYVHQACLQQWLTASATNSCELCKFPFIMHTKIKPFNEVRTIYLTIHLSICVSIYLSVCTACQLIYFFFSLYFSHLALFGFVCIDWRLYSGAALTSPALSGAVSAARCSSTVPQHCVSSGRCVCSSSGPQTMSSVD